jgi:hypothetical protein
MIGAMGCELPGVTCETVTGFPVAGVVCAVVILAVFVGPRFVRWWRGRECWWPWRGWRACRVRSPATD